MDDEQLQSARAMRRRVLGDAYVDGQTADPGPGGQAFQDFVTSTAWGVWTREGPLTTRDRSLLVLAMTGALGRLEEFALHAAAAHRAGVTDEEIDELLFQLGAYCGMPAAVSARRVVTRLRAER